MAIEFLISPAVSITNGSKTLNVTGDVDTYHVFNGTSVVIGNSPIIAIVEGVAGSGQPDLSGNSTITLAEQWALPDVVGEPMIAFNTNEGFVDAQRKALEAANKLLAYVGNQELLLNSTDPVVTIDIDGVPTDFVPYQYLSQSASSAVDTLDTLEPRITAAENDLSSIESTLDGYQSNAAASESNAATSESNAATSESNAATSESNAAASESAAAASATAAASAFDNFDDKYLGAKAIDPTVDNDGDPLVVGQSYWNTATDELRFYNGSVWESPEATASQAAQSASTSESNAATSASNAAASESNAATSASNAAASESNAIDAKEIAMANANFKGEWSTLSGAYDMPLSVKEGNAVYMSLIDHTDITLSQPSVDTSNWFIIGQIGGSASDSDRLGGELPVYYAIAANVVPKSRTINGKSLSSNVNLTKADIGLSNVDDVSDANKPISIATQAALDNLQAQINKNKILAFAGAVL